MTTPTAPMTPIAKTKATARTTPSTSGSVMAPEKPNVVSSHHDTNEPTMNTSPWAKLMSSMMP
jgi:hypothetical protein